MAHEVIRARQIVESPLPSLRIGSYHTVSSAIQRLRFTGTLVQWPNFLQLVENSHNNEPWSRRSRLSPHAFGGHTVEPERVHIGDEDGLRGRFQQAIGHSLGVALELRGTDIYFADSSAQEVHTNTLRTLWGCDTNRLRPKSSSLVSSRHPGSMTTTFWRPLAIKHASGACLLSLFVICKTLIVSMALSALTRKQSSYDNSSPKVAHGKCGTLNPFPRQTTMCQRPLILIRHCDKSP